MRRRDGKRRQRVQAVTDTGLTGRVRLTRKTQVIPTGGGGASGKAGRAEVPRTCSITIRNPRVHGAFPFRPSERARRRSSQRNRSVNEFGVSSWIAHGQPQSRCMPFARPIVRHGNANRVVSDLVGSEIIGVLRN